MELLVLEALTPWCMCWCTLLLPPDVHTFFANLLWVVLVGHGSRGPGMQLKEQLALAALPLRQDTQSMGLSCALVQGLARLWKEVAIFLAPLSLPKELPGSLSPVVGSTQVTALEGPAAVPWSRLPLLLSPPLSTQAPTPRGRVPEGERAPCFPQQGAAA